MTFSQWFMFVLGLFKGIIVFFIGIALLNNTNILIMLSWGLLCILIGLIIISISVVFASETYKDECD